jgi:hypothetical protein
MNVGSEGKLTATASLYRNVTVTPSGYSEERDTPEAKLVRSPWEKTITVEAITSRERRIITRFIASIQVNN